MDQSGRPTFTLQCSSTIYFHISGPSTFMLLNRPVQHFLTVHFNTSRPITWTFSDRPLRLVTVYFDPWSSTSTSQRPLWGPFTLGSDYFFLCAIFNSWVLFQNLPRTKIYSRRVPVNGSNILYFINERINQKTIADSKWFQLRQVFNFWDLLPGQFKIHGRTKIMDRLSGQPWSIIKSKSDLKTDYFKLSFQNRSKSVGVKCANSTRRTRHGRTSI